MFSFSLQLFFILFSRAWATTPPPTVTGVMLSNVSSPSEAGQAAIKVTWTKPSGDSNISRYAVQYGPSPAHPDRWSNTIPVQGADSLTITLTGLARRGYDVRVLAVSDAGVGPYSATATLSTARAPSQVNSSNVTKAVSSGKPALNVSWSAPQSDSPIKKYELQYRKITVTAESRWMSRDVTSTSTTLTNLAAGTGYSVQVRAVSSAGDGPFSMEKRNTTFNIPSQVTGVKLSNMSSSSESGQAAINVTWNKPSSDRPIIKYVVQYGPSPAHPSQPRWTKTMQVQVLTTTLTGLERRSYDVRVLAVSDVGLVGPYSTNSTLNTARVPSQVTQPSVTKTVSSGPALTVSWSAPQSDSPITKYELQYRKITESRWMSRDVISTTTTLPNLDAGTEYAVRVTAVSGVGVGLFSTERRQTTFNVPSKVNLLTVTKAVSSGRPALRVSWSAPNSDSPITKYELQYKKTSDSRWMSRDVKSTTTTLPNLDAGTEYAVRVIAVSGIGNGPFSAERRQTTFNVPFKVNPLTVTKAVSSGRPALTVSWSAPESESPITKYQVQYRKSPSGGWMSRNVTSRSTILPNLDPGTEYAVGVRAFSGAGDGPFSMDMRQITFDVPRQIAAPNLTRSVSSGPALTVVWIRPVSDLPIIRYDVQYKLSSASSSAWSDNIRLGVDTLSTLEHVLPRLSVDTSYDVRVRAVSAAGYGLYHLAAERTHRGPSVVSSVSFTTTKKDGSVHISLTWKAPTTEVPITHYEVMYRESGITEPSFTSRTPAATINGTANKDYLVCIKAVSAVGSGGEKCTSVKPPTPPTVSTTSITTTTATVNWTDEGFQYRLYLQRHGTEIRTPLSPVSAPHTISGLDSNTGYTITVEAYSPLGQAGSNSTVYTVPKAPSSLNLEVVSSTVIRVTWTAPPNADRLTLTYLISYQSEFGSSMKEASTQPVELTGLHPFAEYTVSVRARNTGGQLSGNVTSKKTTLSAAPSSPPQKVLIVDRLKTHNSLTCTWRLPVKTGRNGIITSYLINFTKVSSKDHHPAGNFTKVVDSPSFDAPTHLIYFFTNLSASTLYSIRIAAVTSGGTGVFSASLARKTTLDLYVSKLTTQVTSDTSFTISWAARKGMGSVSSYRVYYGVYLSGAFIMRTTTTTSIQLNDLTPEVPIEVSVIPVVEKEPGGTVSIKIFSREGIPTVAVKNVTVMRINNGVSLRVSWTPLSLHEARGWPLYTVLVESTAGRTTRATLTKNTTNSTVDVDGLDPSTWYSVRVQVGTSAGTNESLLSDIVVVPPPPPPPPGYAVIVAVLVVIILLVIAIVITVVVIVFLYRARKKSAKSFSPSQSESEVEIKGGKGNSVRMMALSSTSEKHDILEGRISNIKNETNPYTVPTSMGASVPKSDFAAHVLMMQKDRDSGFEKEYMSIINDPEGVEAIAKANKLKNRYINIHTFDHSRVVLTVPDENGSDYINASYIDGYKKDNAYIASQGPTPSTITDFWQMIVDHKAPVIVMLTKVEEKGKKKCEKYWEETLNTKVDKGRGIQVTTVKFTPYADYEVREFYVTSSSSPSVQPLTVKHFLYTAWPDHGVPQHPSSLVRFTHKVRRAYQNSAAPIIVHCSAGVGRTGTYLTIDAMMQRIKEVDDLNIYEFVVEMRSKRTFMVQNQDQYAFIHDALCDHITCGDTSIPAHELRRITIGMEANDPKTNKSGFEQQFEFLDSLSKTPCGEDVKFAKKNTISKKNRHRDRCAYSNNHLHIPGKSASNGSDYINASYVDSYSRKNAFIAAQTPLSSTVADFWELLWQFKPPTVVVLTSADDDKDGADFWPTQEEGVADYGVVKVNHKATMPCTDYDRHTLEVVDKRKDKCTPYNLTLFHFKVWSLDSTPYLPSLLDMMGEVERCHSGSTKSITVACSDGMSRTGVFISTMSEVERVKAESEVDLFQTIKLARAKRPFMVFTVEQYKLCFDILQAYLDSFDTYANFKVV